MNQAMTDQVMGKNIWKNQAMTDQSDRAILSWGKTSGWTRPWLIKTWGKASGRTRPWLIKLIDEGGEMVLVLFSICEMTLCLESLTLLVLVKIHTNFLPGNPLHRPDPWQCLSKMINSHRAGPTKNRLHRRRLSSRYLPLHEFNLAWSLFTHED